MTTTKTRDYSHEYQLRQKRQKRLAADMDRAKVDAFKALLETRGTTYISWLESMIDKELERT